MSRETMDQRIERLLKRMNELWVVEAYCYRRSHRASDTLRAYLWERLARLARTQGDRCDLELAEAYAERDEDARIAYLEREWERDDGGWDMALEKGC